MSLSGSMKNKLVVIRNRAPLTEVCALRVLLLLLVVVVGDTLASHTKGLWFEP